MGGVDFFGYLGFKEVLNFLGGDGETARTNEEMVGDDRKRSCRSQAPAELAEGERFKAVWRSGRKKHYSDV